MLIAVAIWMATSEELLQFHHADSILYSLASTQAWTPYYWGQDRLGLLYPLLAMGIDDPLWNLWAINSMTVAAGLASFLLAGWYFASRRVGALTGLAMSGLCVLVVPHFVNFAIFIAHPEYLGSLVWALAALLVLDPPGRRQRPGVWRMGLAGVLMLLATWVNVTIVVFLAPAVLVRSLLRPTPQGGGVWRRVWRGGFLASVAVMAVGLAAGMLLPKLLASGPEYYHTSFALTPPHTWPGAWLKLLRQEHAPRLGRLAIAPAVAGAVLLIVRAMGWISRERFRQGARALLALLASAVCWFLLVGTLKHVASPGFGEFGLRYIILSMVFVVLSPIAMFAVLLAGCRRVAAGVVLLLAAGLLNGLPIIYGLPSEATVMAAFEDRIGPRCRDVIATDCTHVAGHYWHTMDTVWYTNLLLKRQGIDREVYAITDRAGPTYRLWQDWPRDAIGIAAVPYDWQKDMYGLTRGVWFPAIDPTPIEQTEHIRVMKLKEIGDANP